MPDFSKLERIVTHPGVAHKDDFLACSVLLAASGQPLVIERRDPTHEDLADPRCAVVDQGGEHAVEAFNFDHHQFPADAEPRCALSLVLDALGLYEDARQFCGWLQPAEWFDCRGPKETAQFLGISRDAVEKLVSPLDVTLLRRFASGQRWESGNPIWEIMRMAGEDLLSFLRTQRAQIEQHRTTAERWSLGTPETPLEVIFIDRTKADLDDPSAGLDAYVMETYGEGAIHALVYPDRRGTGYGLRRFRDHLACDFTRIGEDPAVTFAHARGFVAKTTATEIADLQSLLRRAAGLEV